MSSSNAPFQSIWRLVINHLDQGILIFNQWGTVIYANPEAERLLGYDTHDLLELEKEDFIALCNTERLDGARFASVFLSDTLEGYNGQVFDLATVTRRLRATPMLLDMDDSEVLVLILKDAASWRADLITQTAMHEIDSPMRFASHYSRMLVERLKDPGSTPYELNDLARIISESLDRALREFLILESLYATEPRLVRQPVETAVDISHVIWEALRDIANGAFNHNPAWKLEFFNGLPPVRASEAHLTWAFMILFQELNKLIPPGTPCPITAQNHDKYIQIEIRPEGQLKPIPYYLFDSLPLVAVEQTFLMHQGRIRVEGGNKRPLVIIMTLPVWQKNAAKSTS
jgi:nitrogen-specific signal transduction histidine kinase